MTNPIRCMSNVEFKFHIEMPVGHFIYVCIYHYLFTIKEWAVSIQIYRAFIYGGVYLIIYNNQLQSNNFVAKQ